MRLEQPFSEENRVCVYQPPSPQAENEESSIWCWHTCQLHGALETSVTVAHETRSAKLNRQQSERTRLHRDPQRHPLIDLRALGLAWTSRYSLVSEHGPHPNHKWQAAHREVWGYGPKPMQSQRWGKCGSQFDEKIVKVSKRTSN